jgi:hypothetical protein
MYILVVILLLVIAPTASVAYEHIYLHNNLPLVFLIGKWMIFWAVGVRLLIAGLRQALQPRFTAHEIFKVADEAALPIVREVGFGNLSMGVLGLASILMPQWLMAAALVGGLYYGLAGLMHTASRSRNFNETVAMVSDLVVAVILLGFLWADFSFRA